MFKHALVPLLNAVTDCFDSLPILQSLLRHLPLQRKTSIVKRLTQYPLIIRANCLNVHYCLHLNDLLQREIYFNCFDRKQLPQLLSYIAPRQVCMDIGANVGFYTFHMARKMKNEGRIYAFEPNPAVFKLLETNRSLNPSDVSIHLYNS